MMAGNPNWWSMNGMHPQSSQFVYDSNSSINPPSTTPSEQDHFPVRSWSQLLLGGLGSVGEEEKYGGNIFQQQKKLENWEDQLVNLNPSFPRINVDVKQEVSQSSSQLYHHHHDHDEFQHPNKPSNSNWPHHHHQVMPVSSSPTSCVTSLSNVNLFNFSGANTALVEPKNHQHNQDHSSECNSTSTGGVSKKARVQQSSAQPALKMQVRKEKLGDRITALHQLVSPFGKTDTASVLSEAIGYIRFLQAQIEALSSPYMRSGSISAGHQPQHCEESADRELRSRGLCLVPISCTQNVGNDINGADYWAPAALGGGGGGGGGGF